MVSSLLASIHARCYAEKNPPYPALFRFPDDPTLTFRQMMSTVKERPKIETKPAAKLLPLRKTRISQAAISNRPGHGCSSKLCLAKFRETILTEGNLALAGTSTKEDQRRVRKTGIPPPRGPPQAYPAGTRYPARRRNAVDAESRRLRCFNKCHRTHATRAWGRLFLRIYRPRQRSKPPSVPNPARTDPARCDQPTAWHIGP